MEEQNNTVDESVAMVEEKEREIERKALEEFYYSVSHGKGKPNPYVFAGLAVLFDAILTLADALGQDRRLVMRFIDQLVRELSWDDRWWMRMFGIKDLLNDFIIHDEKWLANRIDCDIADAIESYKLTSDWEAVKMAETIYTEKESDGSEAQNLLGGEMRATYDFIINQEES